MSYYLCTECENVFRSNYLKTEYGTWEVPCPIADCGGIAFEIDEEMIIPITKLNRKGYMTEFCCAGHVYDNSCGGYISFYDSECTPETVPQGWQKDGDNVIRYSFKNRFDRVEKMKIIHKRIEALTKWCEELKEIDW